MLLELGIFEIGFLAEACLPPSPIARATFWDRLINEIYDKLSDDERKYLFTHITKLNLFSNYNENCQWFYARYNPENQWLLSCFFDGKTQHVECFKKDDKFWISKTTSINPEYIKSVNKKRCVQESMNKYKDERM